MPNYGLNYSEKYVLDTYDMLLGAVGGFYAILWALFGWGMADYEAFNKSYGLIADFYSSESPHANDSVYKKRPDGSIDEKAIKDQLKSELNARTYYQYSYTNFWCYRHVSRQCCFCRNTECF